jgi:diguanylate cyclase (GGDEF)-like protein
MDLDNFKYVNDDLGHHVGDELLCLVAQHIQRHIREIDIFARFGGDEFCVLLVNTTPIASHKVSQKLQLSISELMHSKNWPVTISIGAATFLSFPGCVSEMIAAADQLMYVAKKDRQLNIIHKIIDDVASPAGDDRSTIDKKGAAAQSLRRPVDH